MEFNIVLFLYSLVVIFTVAEAGPQGRIVNGSLATQDQYPYMVALSRGPEDSLKPCCGAAVLSKNWVVTAGHCVYKLPKLILYLGSNNYYAPQFNVTIPATKITLHPDYIHTQLENDIALIKTPDLPLSKHISSVKLPRESQAEDEFLGKIVIASGWGWGSSNRALLNYAYLRVISQEECRKTHGKDYVTKNKFCASTDHGSSTCTGDSGSPLVLDRSRMLIGITSFGRGCVHKNSVGFARVTEYLPWIKKVSGLS